jgi:hypothetical protein
MPDAQIAKAIREGVDRNGQHFRPPMAYEFYSHINDEAIGAIIAYLRMLKPQPMGGKSSAARRRRVRHALEPARRRHPGGLAPKMRQQAELQHLAARGSRWRDRGKSRSP